MTTPLIPVAVRRRARTGDGGAPVELRFVDMLMIVIATLMFLAITLSVVSAVAARGGGADIARQASPPQVTTRSAPTAIAGQPYSLTLAVEGGDGDYTWQATSGDLPDGLSLRPDGTIEGTPERVGEARLDVHVTDGSGRVSPERELILAVRPAAEEPTERMPLRVLSPLALLDDAAEDEPYRHAFRTGAGTPPYRWESGELPSGLRLSADGVLTGRPEDGGTSDFTVTVTDAEGETARQAVRMEVADAPRPQWQQWLRWAVIAFGIVVWGRWLLLGGGFVGLVNLFTAGDRRRR
ncbi:Ig domain-containing protein [Streptomyces sp. NPDC127098]|uniref:Ig domain-containing protein n=1 Tax=Streptomyces sp. NPDC127098 TaxID=3347137 RepID=UPI00365D4D36